MIYHRVDKYKYNNRLFYLLCLIHKQKFILLIVFMTLNLKNVKGDNLTVDYNVSFQKEIPISSFCCSDVESKNITRDSLVIKNVLNGKMKILIPSDFFLMDIEKKRAKYPFLNERTTIYSNREASVNISFDLTDHMGNEKDLPEIKKILDKQYNISSIDFEKSEIQRINGKDFVLLEFVSNAIDTRVYNIMFLTISEGHIVMGAFNCTEMLRQKWESIGKEIIRGIQIL